MSDTVRSFSPARSYSLGPTKRRRSARGCAIPFALLIPLLIIVAIYLMWISRDSVSVAEHLPKDDALRIVASDILEHRQDIAASGIWDSLPLGDDAKEIPDLLTRDIDMPPWVLNNVFGTQSVISGNSIESQDKLLFVTKMHRLGVIIERAFRWFGDVEYDDAGGLGLRHIADSDLYYAVRGRVLMVSPSRRALIHALTLSPEESLTTEEMDRIALDLANQQVGGMIQFQPGETTATYLASLRFSLRFDPNEAHAKFEAELAPEFAQELEPLLSGVRPQTLRSPVDGMFVVSANLAKPLRDVWLALGSISDNPIFSSAQWAEWESVGDDGQPGLAFTLTHLLRDAGPGVQITWYGLDPYEVLPVPELILTTDISDNVKEEILASFPAAPAGLPDYAPFPRVDPEARRIVYPMWGGPSLEPTAFFTDGGMLLSTSSAVADRLVGSPPNQEALPLPGTLYCRIRPQECVRALADAGEQFVDVNALRGYTPESYQEAVAHWLSDAGRIEECSALLSYEDKRLEGELRVMSRAQQMVESE